MHRFVDVIHVVIDGTPTEDHPVVGARIKQAALRGACLIVIDQLFATFQTPGVLLNALTGSNCDGWVATPEYKVTAVHVEALDNVAAREQAATTHASSGNSLTRR